MFLRVKRVRGHDYLFLVENFRDGGKVRQRILHNFGRKDQIELDDVKQVLSRMPTFAFLGSCNSPR